ncbi:MAG: hypothetical protein WA240_09860 [Nitrospirota bacterium]
MKKEALSRIKINKLLEQSRLEPRILIEDPKSSYGCRNTQNMLIFWDNLFLRLCRGEQ